MKEGLDTAQKAYVETTLALAKENSIPDTEHLIKIAIKDIYKIWEKEWISTAEAAEALKDILEKTSRSQNNIIDTARDTLFKIAAGENKNPKK